MSDTTSFPRVVCHPGQVDADRSIIAINTRDFCISRGNTIVTYSHRKSHMSAAFITARLLLQAAPRFVSSRDILVAVFGADESAWPKDRHNASARPLTDLRHRACPRLGLVVDKLGASQFRLQLVPPGTKVETAHQERLVAQGRAKPGRPGLRHFGLELDEAEAQAIRSFAVRHNVSFTEAVRTLIQWGRDSMAEAEKAA